MNQLVVDASVAVKWLLPEPGTEQALSLLETNTILYAPDLMYIEVANVLWKRIQNKEITVDHAIRRLSVLSLTNIITYPTRELMVAAIKLAAEHNHSVYDCVYLMVAIELNCLMITADIKFINKFSNT